VDASKPLTTIKRRLTVENHSRKNQTYDVTSTLRYANDGNGAVTMTLSPTSVTVPPGGLRYVQVKLVVDGTRLRNNLMSSGLSGNAIGPLTANEYDGYVVFKGRDHTLKMPWHILPRKSSDLQVKIGYGKPMPIDPLTGVGKIQVTNKGVGDAQVIAYSMLGRGDDREGGEHGEGLPNPDMRAVGVNSFAVGAGTCGTSANFIWAFAFNMYERKASPVGTIHEVDIDTTGDGVADYAVINQDVSGVTTLTDGRQVTAVINLATGASVARFGVEHSTNSTNLVQYVCGSDLGLTLADAGRPMKAEFYAYSWYFGGAESHLGPFMIAPGGEEYAGSVPGDVVSYGQTSTLTVQQFGLFPGTSKHAGLMLINDSDFGSANRGGATAATEAVLLADW
jgi:hypothetical protein